MLTTIRLAVITAEEVAKLRRALPANEYAAFSVIKRLEECLAAYEPAMVQTAQERYHRDGEIEIDEGATVSRAPGNPNRGAYVQAWVWVDDEDGEEA